MAYVFDKTLKMMGDDSGKKDIFRGGEPGQVAGGVDQQQIAQGGKEKTSIAGNLRSSGGSGTTRESAVGASDIKAPSAGAGSAIMANIGKQKAPQAVEVAQKDLSKASKELQNEADEYVKSQTKDYSVDEGTLEKAASGDTEAMTDVSGTLQKSPVGEVEAFKPETDVTSKAAYGLSTPAGVEATLAREQGPTYTKGMAQFDRALLGYDPNFNRVVNQIKGQQEGLLRESGQMQETKTQEAEQANAQALAQSQEGVSTWLQTEADRIKQAQEEEARKEALYRDYLRGNYRSEAAPFMEEFEARKQEDIRNTLAPALEQLGAQSGITRDVLANMSPEQLNEYINVSKDPVTAAMMYDQGEATRFNNLMAMLGGGETAVAGNLGAAFDPANIEGMSTAVDDRIDEMNKATQELQPDTIKQTPDTLDLPVDQSGGLAVQTGPLGEPAYAPMEGIPENIEEPINFGGGLAIDPEYASTEDLEMGPMRSSSTQGGGVFGTGVLRDAIQGIHSKATDDFSDELGGFKDQSAKTVYETKEKDTPKEKPEPESKKDSRKGKGK